MTPTPRVIDLSHHNSIPKDLLEAAASGIVGVIHKLTEGVSVVDDKAQARHYLAAQAGLAWGIYHFLRPGDDMHDQAAHFLNTARALDVADAETLYVADHEDENVTGEQLKEFLDLIEDATGHSPVIYSGHVLKDQLAGTGYHPKRRLWLCQYCAPPPTLPEGVDAFWLWQYSQSATVPGITPPTDVNWFEGDTDEFLRGWSGRHNTLPAPSTKPVITISSDVPVQLCIGENVEVQFR